MITYGKANSKNDLEGILKLQKINLTKGLSAEEIQQQGFVTVDHSYEQLKNLNDHENHIIAKDGDEVVGYVLAMTVLSRQEIPILVPMFDVFDSVLYEGKKLSGYRYLVVGQVCVDKNYRGKGIFDQAYATYKDQYQGKYDFAITEIATTNQRSLNAHKRIGFEEVHMYKDPNETDWIVVVWDWMK
ncbi:MAG: GNAT family N-acetyltransferase [Cyclobacteriaceae bacterium]